MLFMSISFASGTQHKLVFSGIWALQFTVNLDIFGCMHFRGSVKSDNFAWITIHIVSITGPLGFYENNVQDVHISANI